MKTILIITILALISQETMAEFDESKPIGTPFINFTNIF